MFKYKIIFSVMMLLTASSCANELVGSKVSPDVQGAELVELELNSRWADILKSLEKYAGAQGNYFSGCSFNTLKDKVGRVKVYSLEEVEKLFWDFEEEISLVSQRAAILGGFQTVHPCSHSREISWFFLRYENGIYRFFNDVELISD